jgi:hypothetical protein
MFELLYQADRYWTVPGDPVYDPRTQAWVETDRGPEVTRYLSRQPTHPSESPRFVEYGPQRVVLEVDMRTPGLVVLADVFYPGWRLTVDGGPAELLRVNRLMRGAAVPSGRHRLVYTFEPASFRLGAAGTGLGLLACAAVVFWARRGRRTGEEVAT